MMKTFLDTKIILIVVIAILALTNFFSCSKNRSLAEEKLQLNGIISEKDDSIRTTITSNGNIRSEKLAVEADFDLLTEHYPEEIKRLEEEHAVELKRLMNLTTVSGSTSSTGSTRIDTLKIQVGDTLMSYPGIQIREEWFHFDGWWADEVFEYKRTNYIELSFATYFERKGKFWNRKYESHVSVVTEDPNVQFTGLRSINVPPPPQRKWGIDVIGGAGITGKGASWFVGIGLGRRLVSF